MIPSRGAVAGRAVWISDRVPATAKPRDPAGLQGLLTRARPKGQPYKETVDQAPLTSVFDLKMARGHSGSFDKFYREVSRLLGIGEGM